MERSEEGRNEEDLISKLPKDVIGSILERVPVKDAVRTCVLSTNWRYNWISIRKLNFDNSFFCDLFSNENLLEEEYAELIHNILQQHSGSLCSFPLFARLSNYGKWEDPIIQDLYSRILYLVSTKGVKECTILNQDIRDQCDSNERVALKALYSFSEITSLQLVNIDVSLPPAFNGFVNLVSLEFEYVRFCGDSLESLVSSCRRLEHLTLEGYFGPSTFNICSTSLKSLNIVLDVYVDVSIDAILLEELSVGAYHVTPASRLAPLKSFYCLKSLYMFYGHSSYQKMLVCLLQNSPNLLQLKLRISLPYFDSKMDESTKFPMLTQLKLLKVTLQRWSEEELIVLKVLLSRSPSLEKIEIVWDSFFHVSPKGKQEHLRKLANFPRASLMAKLVIDGMPTDW